MQNDASDVMASRLQPVDLAIEHVREPGQRMPIAGIRPGEGPAHSVPAKACHDLWISPDVIRVVEADELKENRRCVDGNNRQCQKHVNPLGIPVCMGELRHRAMMLKLTNLAGRVNVTADTKGQCNRGKNRRNKPF
jgi:hypothetical protein